MILPWLYLAGPFQLVAVCIFSFRAASVLTIFITMLHWLYGIYPVRSETKISFRDQGITERLPNGQQFDCNYRQFFGWAMIERPFKGHLLQILLLKRLVKGRTFSLEIALPDANIRDQVVQILNDRHVAQAPDLKPSWEAR
ncbi:MAG: hypothetical protein NTU79_01200 [Planctomycetota bacterium]|nr:hypothetical protein [Planctomycetota bacterium]